MNFEEWLNKQSPSPEYDGEDLQDAWKACKKEILRIVKNTKAPKVPGMEGLGGCSWEDMDAETFREILIEKIEKL